MARQRFIWPTLWTDPTLARLEPVAMLLFIGCFSNADDDGRLLGDPAYLKGTIFPYQPMTAEQVEQVRDELLEKCPTLVRYDVEGVTYLAFRCWDEYQKPKYPKPSKLPPPPFVKRRKRSRLSQKSSGSDSGSASGNDSVESEESFPHRVGQGRAGLGSSKGSSEARYAGRAAREEILGSLNGTSFERTYEVDQILAQVKGADHRSRDTLLSLASQLPPGAIADVRVRCRGHTVKWAVGALKGKIEERGAA